MAVQGQTNRPWAQPPRTQRTDVVAYGPDCELRVDFGGLGKDYQPQFEGAHLVLKRRRKGAADVVPLPAVTGARWKSGGTLEGMKQPSYLLLKIGDAWICASPEQDPLLLTIGGAPFQAALRIARSVANRPSDYGYRATQLEAARAIGPGAVLSMLPKDRLVGHSKRSISEGEIDELAGDVARPLEGMLLMACSAPVRQVRPAGIGFPADLHAWLEKTASARRMSVSQLVVALLEKARQTE